MRLRAGEAGGEGESLLGSAPPGRPEAPTSLRFPQRPTPRSLPLMCLSEGSVPAEWCLQRVHETTFNFLNAR